MTTREHNRDSRNVRAVAFLSLLTIAAFFAPIVLNGVRALGLVNQHETIDAVVVESGTGLLRPAQYEFSILGATYEGRSGQEKVGAIVKVAYRKDDPARNRPKNGLFQDIAFAAGILFIAVVVFFLQADASPPRPVQGATAENT